MPEKYYKFNYLVDKINELLRLEKGTFFDDVEVIEDQYNNTIKLYYETTEWWDEEKGEWSNEWEDDE